METNFEIEKELKTKRSKFDFFDSSFACVAFIVLLLVFDTVLRLSWSIESRQYLYLNNREIFFLIAAGLSVISESVFFFSGLITAGNTKVAYFKASKFSKKPSWKTMIFAVIISAVSIIAFSSLTNVFVYSLEKLGYKPSLEIMQMPNFGFYLLNVLAVCIVPAICEESLFRGVILQGFRGKGKHFAVIMSALIFMLMHGGPDQTVHQFILGVILGYVFVYSGSIWVTIFIHFLNNFISVTMIYIMSAKASEAASDVATQLPSWGTLAYTLVYGLAFAALGAYIIYVCMKQIKKEREEIYQKNKEVMLAFVSKENLSKEELSALKKAIADVKDYENDFGEAKEDKDTTDSAEDTTNIETLKDKQKSKMSIASLVLLVASITYLVIDWMFTLISGFSG